MKALDDGGGLRNSELSRASEIAPVIQGLASPQASLGREVAANRGPTHYLFDMKHPYDLSHHAFARIERQPDAKRRGDQGLREGIVGRIIWERSRAMQLGEVRAIARQAQARPRR
jgi:hypothetical protein